LLCCSLRKSTPNSKISSISFETNYLAVRNASRRLLHICASYVRFQRYFTIKFIMASLNQQQKLFLLLSWHTSSHGNSLKHHSPGLSKIHHRTLTIRPYASQLPNQPHTSTTPPVLQPDSQSLSLKRTMRQSVSYPSSPGRLPQHLQLHHFTMEELRTASVPGHPMH
jgi:hypothetical protein